MTAALDGYDARPFSFAGKERTVFWRGDGPGVVVMTEVPGITPQVAAFGRRVADAGFTAVLPSLFGTPGRRLSTGALARTMAEVCISREFRLLSERGIGPIADWLRALCRHVHAECGGPGVGALGMCLTGGFALALMVDDVVMAPVLSQPSVPLPLGGRLKRGLGVDAAELARVKQRVDDGVCVLGLRFSEDPLVPPQRFARLEAELGDGFEPIEIDSRKGNQWGISAKAHSVLARDFVDEDGHPTKAALDRVLAFFDERLRSAPGTTA